MKLFATLVASLSLINAAAGSMSPIVKASNDAYTNVVKDPEALRALYSDVCVFKLCVAPGVCNEGNYDQVMASFVYFAGKYVPKFEYHSQDDTELMWTHSGYYETKSGCGAMLSGITHETRNADGKVIRHVGILEDSGEVMACIMEHLQSLEGEKNRTVKNDL